MPPSKVPCLGILDQNSCCASRACMLANKKEAKGENSLRHKSELGGSGIKATVWKSSQKMRVKGEGELSATEIMHWFGPPTVLSLWKNQSCPAEKLSCTQKAGQPFIPPRTWVLKSPCAGEVQERQFCGAAEINCTLQCNNREWGKQWLLPQVRLAPGFPAHYREKVAPSNLLALPGHNRKGEAVLVLHGQRLLLSSLALEWFRSPTCPWGKVFSWGIFLFGA